MERIGVPIVVLMQRSVPEIFGNIRLLGRAAGVPDRGEEVAGRLETRLARTMQRVGDREPPRAVMITGRLGNGLPLVRARHLSGTIRLAGVSRSTAAER
jgi:iron complex transport system substrate-binding protein